ncbi:hypothetical protein [Actinoplanes flavus]|uniref:hypothetical protein n=1 Tax=Actinoplanes flavus TaxID=2820290 RepID=UPI001EE59EF1|nr:hypothetical protein [Actinoplanes flavus]
MQHPDPGTPVTADAFAAHGIPRDKIFAEKISTRMRVRPQFEAALTLARQIKAHAAHCRVILTVKEMKRLGRDAAARHGKHGGRPPVITDDMLHTVLRRRAAGETVEQIQPDLIIPTGKRKGRTPSVASIYRALAAHEKTQAYPDAVEQAHAEHAQHAGDDLPPIVRPRPARVLDPVGPELAARIQGRPLDRLTQPLVVLAPGPHRHPRSP